jgi:hypothetical protein
MCVSSLIWRSMTSATSGREILGITDVAQAVAAGEWLVVDGPAERANGMKVREIPTQRLPHT